MRGALFGILTAGLLAGPAIAQTDRDRFVESNLITTFYHELAHALIDLMDLSVLGQEEDAADVLSVLMIDSLFEGTRADEIAEDTARGYLIESRHDTPALWVVHGPDEQRFYNVVCLHYGADTRKRDDFAHKLDLPRERAVTCAHERALADKSWGRVLRQLRSDAPGRSTVVPGNMKKNRDALRAFRVLSTHIEEVNAQFALPNDLSILIERCGEANAFYEPDRSAILICTEFVGYLREIADE